MTYYYERNCLVHYNQWLFGLYDQGLSGPLSSRAVWSIRTILAHYDQGLLGSLWPRTVWSNMAKNCFVQFHQGLFGLISAEDCLVQHQQRTVSSTMTKQEQFGSLWPKTVWSIKTIWSIITKNGLVRSDQELFGPLWPSTFYSTMTKDILVHNDQELFGPL